MSVVQEYGRIMELALRFHDILTTVRWVVRHNPRGDLSRIAGHVKYTAKEVEVLPKPPTFSRRGGIFMPKIWKGQSRD